MCYARAGPGDRRERYATVRGEDDFFFYSCCRRRRLSLVKGERERALKGPLNSHSLSRLRFAVYIRICVCACLLFLNELLLLPRSSVRPSRCARLAVNFGLCQQP